MASPCYRGRKLGIASDGHLVVSVTEISNTTFPLLLFLIFNSTTNTLASINYIVSPSLSPNCSKKHLWDWDWVTWLFVQSSSMSSQSIWNKIQMSYHDIEDFSNSCPEWLSHLTSYYTWFHILHHRHTKNSSHHGAWHCHCYFLACGYFWSLTIYVKAVHPSVSSTEVTFP